MRFEIIIFFIAAFLIANIYSDGKYMKLVLSWKKYYQMAGIAFGAFVLYWLIRKNPTHAKNLIMSSNEYIKYLPVDRNAADMISPILDFTSKHGFARNQAEGSYNLYGSGSGPGTGTGAAAGGISMLHPILEMPNHSPGEQRMMNSGKKATKRSVSETKKKFVASSQNWRCGNCTKQLPAWFEVDHKIRLEHGGSNHIDNLVALCRDCHGEKTAIENL